MKRPDYQQPLPPMLLTKDTQADLARTNCSQDDPGAVVAALFDAALTGAGISSGEASYLLGISESLVNRMRSANYREGPSLIQIVKLGPVFVWELHKAMHRTFGFGRRALGELLEAVGLVGVNQ